MPYTVVNNHKITIRLSMIKRYNYHIHIIYIYIQSCFCEFQDISSNHLARKTPSSLNKPLFMIVYVQNCIELFHSFKKKTHSSHGWRVEGLRPTQIAKPPRHAGAQNVQPNLHANVDLHQFLLQILRRFMVETGPQGTRRWEKPFFWGYGNNHSKRKSIIRIHLNGL